MKRATQNTNKGPARRIKREPLSESEDLNLQQPSPKKVTIKSEVISPSKKIPLKQKPIKTEPFIPSSPSESESSEEERDELPSVNPNEPRNYRRIRLVSVSDSDSEDSTHEEQKQSQKKSASNNGNAKAKKSTKDSSSDDDEYVPLRPKVNDNTERNVLDTTDDSSSEASPKPDNKSKQKNYLSRSERKFTHSSTNESSSEVESDPLNGFVSADDSIDSSSSEKPKSKPRMIPFDKPKPKCKKIHAANITKSQTPQSQSNSRTNSSSKSKPMPLSKKPKPPPKIITLTFSDDSSSDEESYVPLLRPSRKRKMTKSPDPPTPSTSEEEEESEDESTDDNEVNNSRRKQIPRRATLRRASRSKSNDSSDSDSSSSSSTRSTSSEGSDRTVAKPRKRNLTNDEYSELRKFLPASAKVSSKRQKAIRCPTPGPSSAKRQRRNSSSDYVQDAPEGQGDGDSDDSFIDNVTQNYGNLESPSSSDDEVEQEAEDVLDLNSDNYEELSSSDSNKKDDDGDSSQSESDNGGVGGGVRLVTIGRDTTHDVIPDMCLLCDNLGKKDFKNRNTRTGSKTWCKCGSCKVVSTRMLNYDRICCKEIGQVSQFLNKTDEDISCITEHSDFKKNVLQYQGFIESMMEKLHGPAKAKLMKREISSFNRATDKEKVAKCRESFIRWIFGRIGSDNRMVVPACVVNRIRKKHTPSAGNLYFDVFKPKKVCQYGKHCVKALHHI